MEYGFGFVCKATCWGICLHFLSLQWPCGDLLVWACQLLFHQCCVWKILRLIPIIDTMIKYLRQMIKSLFNLYQLWRLFFLCTPSTFWVVCYSWLLSPLEFGAGSWKVVISLSGYCQSFDFFFAINPFTIFTMKVKEQNWKAVDKMVQLNRCRPFATEIQWYLKSHSWIMGCQCFLGHCQQ